MEMLLTFHFGAHPRCVLQWDRFMIVCVCVCKCDVEVCTIGHTSEQDKEYQQCTAVRGVCFSFGIAVTNFTEENEGLHMQHGGEV
jgi:hypothetical protein